MMTPRHTHFSMLLLSLTGLALFACDPALEDEPGAGEELYFEGSEVAELLREDPDHMFVVELDQQRCVFDQRDAALDFSHFLVRESASSPTRPLPALMDEVGIEASAELWWTQPGGENEGLRGHCKKWMRFGTLWLCEEWSNEDDDQ